MSNMYGYDEDNEDEDGPLAASPPVVDYDEPLPGALSDKINEEWSVKSPAYKAIIENYKSGIEALRAQRGLSTREKIGALLIGFGQPTSRRGGWKEGIGNASQVMLGQAMASRKDDRRRAELIAKYEVEKGPKALDAAYKMSRLEAMNAAKKPTLAFDVYGRARDRYSGEIINGSGPGGAPTNFRTMTGTEYNKTFGGALPPDATVRIDPAGNPTIMDQGGKAPSTRTNARTGGTEVWNSRTQRYEEEPSDIAAETSDQKMLAQSLGIPHISQRMPKFNTAKARDQYLQARAKEGENELLEINKEVNKATQLANTAKEFIAINKNVATGPAQKMVPEVLNSDEMQKLKNIQKGLTALVPRTPGAISNYEAAGLEQSTLSPTSYLAVNEQVARRYQAYGQLSQEYQQFLDSWATVHGGSIDGADAIWKRYLNANPIFDPKVPDKIAPNKARLPYVSWAKKTFFGSQTPVAATPSQQARSPAKSAAPVAGARKAPDGNWYVPNPDIPGNYLRVDP